MKILLVKPPWFVNGSQYRYLEHVQFTPLALGILAALSPGHEVRMADADWEEVPPGEGFDLVGISASTFTSERAFALADSFRKAGVPVVLGGVHPSIMPDECLQHANSVVIGEAEYVWADVLRDAEKRSLKPVYRAERPTDMNDVPMPRRDFKNESSWFACVQATRGCPNSCRYCYLPSVPWGAFRKRPVELVQEEIRLIRQRVLLFVDDNIFGDREYALRLFRAIAPYGKYWAIQAPTTIGDDDEMLDAMEAAGCFNVLVGFQSFNKESLEMAAVSHNIGIAAKYRKIMEKFHARKMVVNGFFMFGFDSDGPDSFASTTEMIKRLNIDDANLFAVTPYPGTPLYAQFEREKRILPGIKRSQFNWAHAVFKPKLMSPEELERGVQLAYDSLQGYFRKRLLWFLLNHWRLLLRNLSLLKLFVTRNFNGGRVSREPE